MDNQKIILIGGGVAAVIVLLLLFRGSGSGSDVAVIRTGNGANPVDETAKLGVVSNIFSSLLGFQLSQDKLASDERLATAALKNEATAAAAGVSIAQQQSASQLAAQQAASQLYYAQLQAQQDAVNAAASAQKTASIWGGIGSIGGSIINSIFGNGGGGFGGGGYTPPFFNPGVVWNDVGATPSYNPYNTDIFNYTDPLKAIGDRLQNTLVDYADALPNLSLNFGSGANKGYISGVFDHNIGGYLSGGTYEDDYPFWSTDGH